jgi:hypothetical protein
MSVSSFFSSKYDLRRIVLLDVSIYVQFQYAHFVNVWTHSPAHPIRASTSSARTGWAGHFTLSWKPAHYQLTPQGRLEASSVLRDTARQAGSLHHNLAYRFLIVISWQPN